MSVLVAVASVLAAHTAVGFTPLPRFAAPLGHSPRVASGATPAASAVAATRFRRRSCSRRATEDGEDLPASSDIDWDKEWSKVARGEVKASEPGLEPPSEIQKAQYKGAWLNPLDVDDAPPPAARTHLSTYATGPLHSAHRPTLTPSPPCAPVQQQINQVKVPVPTWDALRGDWKFWIGIIVAISVGTALLGNVADDSVSLYQV